MELHRGDIKDNANVAILKKTLGIDEDEAKAGKSSLAMPTSAISLASGKKICL